MMHRRRILLRRRFVLLLLRVRLVGLGRPRRLSRECHENDDESDSLLLTKCALTFFLRFFPLEKKVSSAVKKRKRNTLVARHMSAETENAAKNTDDRRRDEGGEENKPSMHFIVQNVSKKHNIGTICRNCTAFDVTSMHLVGNAHYNVFGSHGSDAHVRIEHHPTLEECRETMKEKLKCAEILGVEITEESEDVSEYTFKGNTAFVLGMCVRYRSMFCCSIVVVRESFSLLFVFRDEKDRHVCMYVCVCVYVSMYRAFRFHAPFLYL